MTHSDEEPKLCPFCKRQVVLIDPLGGQRSCQADYEYTQIKHVIGEPPCFLDKHNINLEEWDSRPIEKTLQEELQTCKVRYCGLAGDKQELEQQLAEAKGINK